MGLSFSLIGKGHMKICLILQYLCDVREFPNIILEAKGFLLFNDCIIRISFPLGEKPAFDSFIDCFKIFSSVRCL